MSDEDPRLAELVKQAVTSKSCDSISPEHAELLVISQLCRPGIMTHNFWSKSVYTVTLRANRVVTSNGRFKCIFCPLLTSIYKKEVDRCFNTKEGLRRHYEQHFNTGFNEYKCHHKLPDGTQCNYTCRRSDHLDRHFFKMHKIPKTKKQKNTFGRGDTKKTGLLEPNTLVQIKTEISDKMDNTWSSLELIPCVILDLDFYIVQIYSSSISNQ